MTTVVFNPISGKFDLINVIDPNDQILSTRANNVATGGGQIYLNGTTGNRIDFNTNGVAAPALTTRSVGTKIVLYPSLSGSAMDYALGIDTSTFWLSVPGNVDTDKFSFYGATTEALRITGTGKISLSAGSATAPVINAGLNSNDTNTGIYFPATDAIALATNGTRRLRADATGVGFHVDPAHWIHLSTDPGSSKYLNIDSTQSSNPPLDYTPSGGNTVNKVIGITQDSNVLGTPDYWMEIKLDGVIVLVPCYIPYVP